MIAAYPAYSQASIYRDLQELQKYQLIEVVSTTKVHSVIERTFRLRFNLTSEVDIFVANRDQESMAATVITWMNSVTTDILDYLEVWAASEEQIWLSMGREDFFLNETQALSFLKEVQQLVQKYQSLPSIGGEHHYGMSFSWAPIQLKEDK